MNMKSKDNPWSAFYLTGAVFTLLVLCGVIADMVIGSVTGGNIASLPHTAIERFEQLKTTPFLGLYNLDLLNVVNQILLIPSLFALYASHRHTNPAGALFAFILFMAGTILFVAGNTSLTMLDLSHKYFSAGADSQKNLLAAAGEAMLARGEHGSFSVLAGFAIPTFANFLMSLVMLKGKVFGKTAAWTGIAGNALMMLYIFLVTFNPGAGKSALAFAMPGGLLLMTWMILYSIRLFRLHGSGNYNQA
jgi:hypothetical protein